MRLFDLDLRCFGCDRIWHQQDVTDDFVVEVASHYLTHQGGSEFAMRLIEIHAQNNPEEEERMMQNIRFQLWRLASEE